MHSELASLVHSLCRPRHPAIRSLGDLCMLATKAFIPVTESLETQLQHHPSETLVRHGAHATTRILSPAARLLFWASDLTDLVYRWNGHYAQVGRRQRMKIRLESADVLRISFGNDANSLPAVDAIVCGVLAGTLAFHGFSAGFHGQRFDPPLNAGDLPGISPWHEGTPDPERLFILAWPSSDRRIVPRGHWELSACAGELAPVVAALESEPGRPWRLSDAAIIHRASERTLRRHLRQAGTSFPALLTSVRMPRAADALINSNRTISWIAHEHGFYDAAHFSHAFVVASGIPPQRFRRILSSTRGRA